MDEHFQIIDAINKNNMYKFIIELSKGIVINTHILSLTINSFRYDMFEHLLSIGVPIPLSIYKYFTDAIKIGDIELVEIYLKHGMQITNNHIDLAIYHKRTNVLNLLLDYR